MTIYALESEAMSSKLTLMRKVRIPVLSTQDYHVKDIKMMRRKGIVDVGSVHSRAGEKSCSRVLARTWGIRQNYPVRCSGNMVDKMNVHSTVITVAL